MRYQVVTMVSGQHDDDQMILTDAVYQDIILQTAWSWSHLSQHIITKYQDKHPEILTKPPQQLKIL